MRLRDRAPEWIHRDGVRVGFMFLSPTDDRFYQICFFAPTTSKEQRLLIDAVLGEGEIHRVQRCKPECGWTCTPPPEQATFDNISVTPSLDGSPGGLWHGHITNGHIVGGI